MPKLNASYVYGKGNKRMKSSYRISLQKVACEENGFDENTDVDIVYEKNKITILKKPAY